jgi:foldase protein PrsA
VVAPAIGTVTEERVEALIKERGLDRTPERRDLRVVVTETRAQAQAARAALERGATWKQVARRYSIDVSSAHRGGRISWQAEGTLIEPLDRAVFRARKGRLVGPVRTAYGYYVVVVRRIAPARTTPTKEQRTLARELAESEAQQALLDAFVKSFTATWKARTVCARAFDFVSDCGNWDGTEIRP